MSEPLNTLPFSIGLVILGGVLMTAWCLNLYLAIID